MHVFLCFDAKSPISMWLRGERPTEVIAIFELDELKTCLSLASGLDICREDKFLCEARCTLNPRISECQTTKGTGRLYTPVSSLYPSNTCGSEKLNIHNKVPQHFVDESKLPICSSAIKTTMLVSAGRSTGWPALVFLKLL